MAKSKGQIEAEISEALIKFEKEYMGLSLGEAEAGALLCKFRS